MATNFIRKINELNPNIKSATVKAVILTKSKPNFFNSKDDGLRGVMTFTVRDSRTSICNCKYWASKEQVEEANRKYNIGNIILILNPLVAAAGHEIFIPKATVRIMLVVREGAGSLLAQDDLRNLNDSNALLELLHQPHKPLSSVLRLADVRCQMRATNVRSKITAPQQERFVDLLVMVAKIKPARTMPNTDAVRCIEVIVIDQSATDGMILSIWHDEWIERAEKKWSAMSTLLHLIDVKVVDSNYHKCAILRLGPQTLIYEDAVGREAQLLRNDINSKARNLESMSFGGNSEYLPRPEDIRTQMTVKQIYYRLEGHLKDETEEFTAVLYALITKFDLDGFGNILARKCKSCLRYLPPNVNYCETEQCQLALSFNNYGGDSFEYFFNINIQLGDHTGTLLESRLSGAVAERLLQISVTDFRELLARQDERITELKWRFLLNYYKVKLFIKKPNAVRRQSVILVVDAEHIEDLAEIADTMLVF